MFGRKKAAKAQYTLTLYAGDGKTLCDLPLNALILPEKAVIELSKYYFDDPEPCEIHRGAVRNRVIAELMEACPDAKRVPLTALDALICACFEADVQFFSVRRRES